jgi:eukaryotic-like serine/threonine-protein kinase
MIGKTLGHYRVGEQLGRGGMGEVYVADDLNLNRKVALKFLPDAFTGDPERMARFEREAKLLASLNHPNIAAIHGLEQAEGKRFLVLELVEGETLAQRISKGALPVEDALAICRQIADGLEAAHEKGVIHRDLKPANVMLTEGDKVKILDFGLAKALSEETQSIDSSQSPTLTEAMTRPGVILGTAAYMSPEQAKGKAVDKRADIWAFGCILYECLTGKRPFEGETVTETLASILKGEPDWSALPATTSSSLRFGLRRCLEKDVSRRFHDAADVRIEIEETREDSEVASPVKRSKLAWISTGIALLLVIALAVSAFLYFRGGGPVEAMRFHVTVPPMTNDYGMAISPNGRQIAFVSIVSGSTPYLFVRQIGNVTPRKIEGTEGAEYPFWSPDGRSVGFCSGGRLKRVDVSGGPSRDLCATANFTGGTWSSNGVIVFTDWPILRRVSAEGGDSTPITALDESRKEVLHFFPHFLPDGNRYLYLVSSSFRSSDIFLGSLNSRERTRLLTGVSMAVYAEPGYLLFQRGRTLFAQPFDSEKLRLSGESVSIADNLLVGNLGTAIFGTSQNGLLVYRSASTQSGTQFVWFDRTGNQLGSAGEPGYRPGFGLSPDGKQIAAARSDPQATEDIWVIQCERNITTRFTFGKAIYACPVWSPDGLQIGFTSSRKGNFDIWVKKASGIGEETPIFQSEDQDWMKDWSKDGRYIAYNTSTGLYALPLFGDRKPFRIVQSPSGLNMPNFSFDGKWIAYNSNETGTWQVYVVPFPLADQKFPISTNSGVQPRWRGDGKELYYLTLDGKMMAVEVEGNGKIKAGIPHILFSTGLVVDPANNQYAVASDGQRFLILKPVSEATATPITVVLNWTSLLKK